MRGNNVRRSAGTVLMAAGLLMILTVAGYFAWSEIQAAQVQAELDQGVAAAAERATEIAAPTNAPQEVAAAVSTSTASPTRRPPTATKAPPSPAAVAAATEATTARLEPTSAPTSAPTDTPAPTATPPQPEKPVRMAIPDLKIDAKVVEMGWEVVQTKSGPVSQWVIPKNAAGHHINSASIGETGNLVISGHNNIYGRVFMPISQAWKNDKRVKVDNFTEKSDVLTGRELTLYDASGDAHNYVITEFYRLKDTGVSQAQRIKNGQYILPTEDERVTIVTCWPPTNNTHRLIVIARPEK